jgi:hypothetical protein
MDIYSKALRSSKPAKDYLLSRGLDSGELWQTFGLGFANGALLEALPQSGGVRDALTEIGVLSPTGREHFAGCVVVPLTHPDQGLVGLYGRKILPDARIRHLYLPGPHRGVLNWQALQRSESVLIAESVLDALSLLAAGCGDVTCLYGVQGMPRDLDDLLGRFNVREVRFCLDGDEAGRRRRPGCRSCSGDGASSASIFRCRTARTPTRCWSRPGRTRWQRAWPTRGQPSHRPPNRWRRRHLSSRRRATDLVCVSARCNIG